MDRFKFPNIPMVPLVLIIVALAAAATILFMASDDAGAAPVACEDQAPSVRVDYASNILSQVPVGATVTHKARVKTAVCPDSETYEDVTLTFIPPNGQSLVTAGNTGAWACTHNEDESLTCTRAAAPAGLTSTLTLKYIQGPYQDGSDRAHGCVTVLSPPLQACNQAWFKALP